MFWGLSRAATTALGPKTWNGPAFQPSLVDIGKMRWAVPENVKDLQLCVSTLRRVANFNITGTPPVTLPRPPSSIVFHHLVDCERLRPLDHPLA